MICEKCGKPAEEKTVTHGTLSRVVSKFFACLPCRRWKGGERKAVTRQDRTEALHQLQDELRHRVALVKARDDGRREVVEWCRENARGAVEPGLWVRLSDLEDEFPMCEEKKP